MEVQKPDYRGTYIGEQVVISTTMCGREPYTDSWCWTGKDWGRYGGKPSYTGAPPPKPKTPEEIDIELEYHKQVLEKMTQKKVTIVLE
jgi:hypothetical protein